MNISYNVIAIVIRPFLNSRNFKIASVQNAAIPELAA
ncbi:hypothetical protein ABIB39_004627 [Mucilaginibacter sp. UYP27]